MRILEITLAAALAAGFLFERRLPRGAKLLVVPIALLQYSIEGYRWQLLPLYGLALLYPAEYLSRKWTEKHAGSPTPARIRALLIVSLFMVGIALSILLPIPRPFPPTGPFQVGTTSRHLVDISRMDPYAPEPGQAREVLVKIWYPAVPADGARPAVWMPDADQVAPAIARWIQLPDFLLDQLVHVRTSAFPDAPADRSGGPYPILLFSHGYGGFRAQNTSQLENLASHGYIVAAVEHTYASVLTIFPDGRQAEQNPDTLPSDLEGPAYEAAAEALLAQWTGDLLFVLSALENEAAEGSGLLEGMLRSGGVGVIGHSTGGGAAVQFCSLEPRCAGALGLDAWLLPVDDELLETGASRPALLLYSEAWTVGPNAVRVEEYQLASGETLKAYWISGTGHYDFTDLPFATPLAEALGLKGPIEGKRMQTIVNELSVGFFDGLLNGTHSADREDPLAVYSELGRFERRSGP